MKGPGRSRRPLATTLLAAVLLAGARQRSLVVVSDPAASDHLGPQRADSAARREFWARLDRLIRLAR